VAAHSAPRPPSWILEKEERKGRIEVKGGEEGTGGWIREGEIWRRGREGKGRERVGGMRNLLFHEAEGIDVPAATHRSMKQSISHYYTYAFITPSVPLSVSLPLCLSVLLCVSVGICVMLALVLCVTQ